MLVTEMRPFQTLYSRRTHFTDLITTKFPQIPKFYRPFHSTNHLFLSESSTVSTVYDPVSNSIVTTRVSNSKHSEPESESKPDKRADRSSNSDYADALKDDRSYGSVLRANQGFFGGVGSKKKSKSKSTWVCTECGYTDGQWWGYCRECSNVNTMKEFTESDNGGKTTGFQVSEKIVKAWLPKGTTGDVVPMRLTDVNRGINHSNWLFPLSGSFGKEVSRVLGGGLVPGSLVLVGGDPGVGKSTLMLQISAIIAEGKEVGKAAPVLYVSGEESVEQIGNRADRMEIDTEELFLYSSTDIEDILQKAQLLSPRALIIDSIQTVYLMGVTGSAGGIYQIKECTTALLRFAKKTNIPVFLIGHVTKSGDIAGPRALEHIVDAVLYMEVSTLSFVGLDFSGKLRLTEKLENWLSTVG